MILDDGVLLLRITEYEKERKSCAARKALHYSVQDNGKLSYWTRSWSENRQLTEYSKHDNEAGPKDNQYLQLNQHKPTVKHAYKQTP